MADRKWVTRRGVWRAIGFVVLSMAVSVAVGYVLTWRNFGLDNPAPAAFLFWVASSCLLSIAFLFLGLVYLIEYVHTYARGGRKVRWRNYALRLVLALTALIGPFWMLDAHPVLAQKPALLFILNVLVAGLSIGLLLWAFSKDFRLSGHAESGSAEDAQPRAE